LYENNFYATDQVYSLKRKEFLVICSSAQLLVAIPHPIAPICGPVS